MQPNTRSEPIREAVAVFIDADKLHEAVDELLASGFSQHQLGLLAGEHTVRQSLGDFYEQVNEFTEEEDAEAPRMAFVRKKSIGDAMHAWAGALFFAGATTGVGAAVVSAGVLGGALLAAVTGAAAVGAVGGALALVLHQSDAEYLEQQVDEGHLLLFVRTHGEDEERRALRTLANHSGFDVRMHDVPQQSRA